METVSLKIAAQHEYINLNTTNKKGHSFKMEQFLRTVLTALFISSITATIVIRTSEGEEISFKPIKPIKQLIAQKHQILSKLKPTFQKFNITSETATSSSSSDSSTAATSSTSSVTTPATTVTTMTQNELPADNVSIETNETDEMTDSNDNTNQAVVRVDESAFSKQSPFDLFSYPSLVYPYPFTSFSKNSPQRPHNIILIPVPFPTSVVHNPPI